MNPPDPLLVERRTALVAAARRVVAEAGADGGVLTHPELAVELVTTYAEDVGTEIDARISAGVDSLEELIHAMIDGALAATAPWKEALTVIALASERITDFGDWSRIVGPWVDTVERVIADGQARGLVCEELDPRTTALTLHGMMSRSTHIGLRQGPAQYRETVARLVLNALRPAG